MTTSTEPQLKTLKSLKIQNLPIDTGHFTPLTIRMASLPSSRWQIHKERTNRPTNNGYMVDKAKCDVVSV